MKKNLLINELETMKRRMDRLYSESFESPKEEDKTDTEPDPEVSAWEPSMDIWESDGELLVVADLPGVPDEDLKVEIMESQLTISGKRKAAPRGKELKASKTERPEGQFSRTFMLPPDVLKENIQAECKRGILTITIPKNHSARDSHRRVIVHAE